MVQVPFSKFKDILSNFNVGFYQPEKESCTNCIAYKNGEKTNAASKLHELHLARKEIVREEKARDKKRAKDDATFSAIIVDMEQVSPCPKGLK